MKNKLLRMGLVGVVLAACNFAGCNLPDLRIGRDRASTSAPRERIKKLSGQQVEDVQLSMARSLELEGKYDLAMDAYVKLSDKAPKLAAPYWRMAVIHDRRGNVQDSARLYRQALDLEPKNSDLHSDYGYSLYLQRRWAEAEDQLRQALAIDAHNRRAHNNLGLLLAQTERSDDALAEFRQAGCNADDAHVNLAFVSMMNQRWDQARDEFQRALDANPGSAIALAGRDKLAVLRARANGETNAAAVVADRRKAAAEIPPQPATRALPAAWNKQAPAGPVKSVR